MQNGRVRDDRVTIMAEHTIIVGENVKERGQKARERRGEGRQGKYETKARDVVASLPWVTSISLGYPLPSVIMIQYNWISSTPMGTRLRNVNNFDLPQYSHTSNPTSASLYKS